MALTYEIRRGARTRLEFEGFQGSSALREGIERASTPEEAVKLALAAAQEA